MTRVMKAQRGSLLSSVVMVMLATVATALLAFIGFQALPDSVIPATFGGEDRTNRHVNVTDSPSPDAPKPVVTATAQPSASASSGATSEPTRASKPTRTGSTAVETTDAPTVVSTTTSPAKPKPSATTSPKPSPSASQTTQTASPAPTCGTGRKPRCPRSAEPASSTSPARAASYKASSYDDYGVPTKSSTDAKKKAHKKPAVKVKARGRR